MKIIGHRGARGLAPENTLEAFETAIKFGVDMIETDVRITKDDKLVLVHDEHLHLPDEQRLHVATSAYKDLRKHYQAIVTLDEAIKCIDRRVRLMIEVKKGVETTPVIKGVQTYLKKGWQPEDFMFNSASYPILKELHKALPEVERVIQGNWSGLRVEYLAKKLDTPYILLDQRYVWSGYVYLKSKNFKLITYTYPWSEKEKYDHFKAEKWEKFGLYALITDYPDHFVKKT